MIKPKTATFGLIGPTVLLYEWPMTPFGAGGWRRSCSLLPLTLFLVPHWPSPILAGCGLSVLWMLTCMHSLPGCSASCCEPRGWFCVAIFGGGAASTGRGMGTVSEGLGSYAGGDGQLGGEYQLEEVHDLERDGTPRLTNTWRRLQWSPRAVIRTVGHLLVGNRRAFPEQPG